MLIYKFWQLLNMPQVQSNVSAKGASVTSLPLRFALQRVPNESCFFPLGNVSVCQLLFLTEELDRQADTAVGVRTATTHNQKFCV